MNGTCSHPLDLTVHPPSRRRRLLYVLSQFVHASKVDEDPGTGLSVAIIFFIEHDKGEVKCVIFLHKDVSIKGN